VQEAGSWVYDHEIAIDTVTIQFDFNINAVGAYDNGFGAGDGMGLMLETNGSTALGGGGGLMGISPLNGYAVEISEFDHEVCLDNSSNKIGIDSLASCTSGDVPDLLVVNTSPGITVGDGNWHTVVVQIDNGAFTVTADGHTESSGYTPSGWSNGSYYLGFGAGTGGAAAYHRVRNVKVTFQTPHCY
jgi:Bacterial lectin